MGADRRSAPCFFSIAFAVFCYLPSSTDYLPLSRFCRLVTNILFFLSLSFSLPPPPSLRLTPPCLSPSHSLPLLLSFSLSSSPLSLSASLPLCFSPPPRPSLPLPLPLLAPLSSLRTSIHRQLPDRHYDSPPTSPTHTIFIHLYYRPVRVRPVSPQDKGKDYNWTTSTPPPCSLLPSSPSSPPRLLIYLRHLSLHKQSLGLALRFHLGPAQCKWATHLQKSAHPRPATAAPARAQLAAAAAAAQAAP